MHARVLLFSRERSAGYRQYLQPCAVLGLGSVDYEAVLGHDAFGRNFELPLVEAELCILILVPGSVPWNFINLPRYMEGPCCAGPGCTATP